MDTIDIDSLDLENTDAAIDLNATCTFLSAATLHSTSSVLFNDSAGQLSERLALLTEACKSLGLTNIPLCMTPGKLFSKSLQLKDFLTLLERACQNGLHESANIDMLEDLVVLEGGSRSEMDELTDNSRRVPVEMNELIAAIEACGAFEQVYVDPFDGSVLTVDSATVNAVFVAMNDHGREGMSEQTALWIAQKHVDADEIEESDMASAIHVYCRNLSDIKLPEDYELLKLMDRCLDQIENLEVRKKLHDLTMVPENAHCIMNAFTEADLGNEGERLYHAAIKLHVTEWLGRHGIAARI